ncbi:Mpv17/PMP22 family protein [Diplogelasinospora grovesii]|uniref:Mpv17/PMP22 family protein n=1 Tax=Diplogelasinospora grovesii TaxID=303347 RepID=A0AAN6S0M5_9PEZI|nr:Mpv17/PMP22 family protein [Diplogelasinospora grovesii]
MAPSPMAKATIQSALIGAASNILAQAITAQKYSKPFVIDWIPVFQFFMFSVVSTPPNFMWQEFLESAFPAHHVAPTKEAIASASAGDEKELDREAREGRLVEPRLNKGNTLIKTLLDQTAGAAVNTVLFSFFMTGIQMAMAHRTLHAEAGYGDAAKSLRWLLLSGKAVNYQNINWDVLLEKTQREFVPIVLAGWTFWPLVSVVNFAFVKSVETRNLVGSLAGLVWGIYMSMFAAR